MHNKIEGGRERESEREGKKRNCVEVEFRAEFGNEETCVRMCMEASGIEKRLRKNLAEQTGGFNHVFSVSCSSCIISESLSVF